MESKTDNSYCVYAHITPSGKKYIGITSMSPYRRWDRGRGYKDNPYFQNAIQKYGWDNITHEILYEHLTKEEAEKMEIQLISQYNTTNRDNGYNIQPGGNLRDNRLEKPIYMYDKNTGEYIMSFDSRNKAEKFLGVSSNIIGKRDTNPYAVRHGYIWKDYCIDHIDTYDKNNNIVLLDLYTKDIIFSDKYLAGDFIYKEETYLFDAIYLHINHNNAMYKKILCLTAGIYQQTLQRDFNASYVMQISKDDLSVINIYPTYQRAAKCTGVSDLTIRDCCLKKQKTSGGFIWESCGLIREENYLEKDLLLRRLYLNDCDNVKMFDLYRADQIVFINDRHHEKTKKERQRKINMCK